MAGSCTIIIFSNKEKSQDKPLEKIKFIMINAELKVTFEVNKI